MLLSTGRDAEAVSTVWIFHGDNARFASGVFDGKDEALAWIAGHRLTGVLTEYPVGGGCYDIAVAGGQFRPTRPHHGSPAHVARFSPAVSEHVHASFSARRQAALRESIRLTNPDPSD